MRQTVNLLGTSLELKKGQLVEVTPATNLPAPNYTKWYARPVKKNAIWRAQSEDTSVIVTTPNDIWLLK